VIDPTNRRVLEVLETREKTAVVAYLQEGKARGVLAHLEEVPTDMWDGYVEAVREVFGATVRVTIDRFHVMKNFQEQLTEARRQIQRGLSQEEAQALQGSRWLWLTNREHLDESQRATLAELQQRFPLLGQLADQREELRQIFEDRHVVTPTEGTARLRAWMAKARPLGLKALDKFCNTLENWLDKIVNYFVSRSSNGRTEGFNHGLRAILWRAFGMFNFQHFRLRVLDRFGKPQAQESP
jgi:transposase